MLLLHCIGTLLGEKVFVCRMSVLCQCGFDDFESDLIAVSGSLKMKGKLGQIMTPDRAPY